MLLLCSLQEGRWRLMGLTLTWQLSLENWTSGLLLSPARKLQPRPWHPGSFQARPLLCPKDHHVLQHQSSVSISPLLDPSPSPSLIHPGFANSDLLVTCVCSRMLRRSCTFTSLHAGMMTRAAPAPAQTNRARLRRVTPGSGSHHFLGPFQSQNSPFSRESPNRSARHLHLLTLANRAVFLLLVNHADLTPRSSLSARPQRRARLQTQTPQIFSLQPSPVELGILRPMERNSERREDLQVSL